MPRLGSSYAIQLDVTSKPIAEYHTDEYFGLDLPVAPAVMVADEIVIEGSDVSEDKIEAVTWGCPHPPAEAKGFSHA
jgi:hypothetical protein